MGGAGMRSAAKLGGLGMGGAASRLRGSLPSAIEQPAAQRAGQSLRSAVINSPTVPVAENSEVAPVQTSWESEDWEFAEFETVDPPPRLVFGPAPSLEETQAATRDLKHALEKGYPFPINPAESVPFARPDHSSLSSSHLTEMNCGTIDSMSSPVVTSVVRRAFRLLSESPAAQATVASIAADPNVWKAVMQNSALQDYMESYCNPTTEESVGDTTCPKPDETEKLADLTADESVSGEPANHGNPFVDVLEFIKGSVVDMANNAFAHIKNMFGFSSPNHGSDSDAKFSENQSTYFHSFLGLAIMVIMVVIFKRI